MATIQPDLRDQRERCVHLEARHCQSPEHFATTEIDVPARLQTLLPNANPVLLLEMYALDASLVEQLRTTAPSIAFAVSRCVSDRPVREIAMEMVL